MNLTCWDDELLAGNDEQSLLTTLTKLDSQADALKEQWEKGSAEAETWAKRIRALNSKINTMWHAYEAHKKERNAANETVQRLKQQRSELFAQMDANRAKHATLGEKILKLQNMTRHSASSAVRQVRELDWQIQTMSLTPVEENKILYRIKFLEEQRLIHEEIATLEEQLCRLKEELETLHAQNSTIRGHFDASVIAGQSHHEKMLTAIRETTSLRDEKDVAIHEYQERQRLASEIRRKYFESLTHIEMIIRKIDELKKLATSKQAEIVSEAVYKKLKAKKKLTLDELKLIERVFIES